MSLYNKGIKFSFYKNPLWPPVSLGINNKFTVNTISYFKVAGRVNRVQFLNTSTEQNNLKTVHCASESNYKKAIEELYSLNAVKRSKTIKGFLGQGSKRSATVLNYNALLHHNTKSVVYSFNPVNRLYPLLTKTEYLLKSVFRSMFSLISRPIYLIKHDKIIIRLFVYLSPKIDKYLDSSTIGKFGIIAGFSAPNSSLKRGKFLKFKSLRPNTIDILKYQIQHNKQSLRERFRASLQKPTFNNKEQVTPFISVNNLLNSVTASGVSASSDFTLEQGLALHLQGKEVMSSSAKTALEMAIINDKIPYNSLASNFKFKLEKLCLVFEKIFNKKVEFDIIKAQLPFQDSNILAQILGYNANKYKFRRMLKILIPRAVIKNPSKEILRNQIQGSTVYGLKSIDPASVDNAPLTIALANGAKSNLAETNLAKKYLNMVMALGAQPSSYLPPFFYNKNNLNFISRRQAQVKKTSISYLSGMNVKLAGRLMTQSMRPRFTVQNLQEGSLARVKVHFIENSRFTGKNKRGAFTFTVTISHVFN